MKTKQCFSYIRYSSKKQGKEFGGSSEWRQAEIAPRVAKEKGWQLVENWAAEDLGKSGYKGDNVQTIRSIIANVKKGNIPQGTVCIIEGFDRYSRLQLDDAYQLLRDLLKSGIEVYVDRNNRHLTQDDLNKPMSVMMTVSELDASFQYADNLANRIRKSWTKKRDDDGGKENKDKSNTKTVPAWIDSQTWTVIKAKADVVKRIFKMFEEGKGVTSIALTLNAEKVPTFGGGKYWNTTYIADLFTNGLVIGERHHQIRKDGKKVPTGEVTKGFYPACIDEAAYYAVKTKYLNSAKKQFRKNDSVANLFAGIAFCTCGERINKVKGRLKNYCGCKSMLMHTGCKQGMMNYDTLEKAFATSIKIYADKMMPEASTDRSSEINTIQGKMDALQGQIDNITSVVLGGKATKALVAAQSKLESEVESLKAELANVASKPAQTKPQDVLQMMNGIDKLATDSALRTQVRNWLFNIGATLTLDENSYTAKLQLMGKNLVEYTFKRDNDKQFEIGITYQMM